MRENAPNLQRLARTGYRTWLAIKICGRWVNLLLVEEELLKHVVIQEAVVLSRWERAVSRLSRACQGRGIPCQRDASWPPRCHGAELPMAVCIQAGDAEAEEAPDSNTSL